MTSDNATLGRASTAFALSATIAILFNTLLAWVKDAYKPLNALMNAVAWHNWITHGLADLILFFALGLLFSKTSFSSRISPNRVISFLVLAVVAGGIGLFAWYALF